MTALLAAIVIPFAFTAPPAVAPDSATATFTFTAPYDNSGALAYYDLLLNGGVLRWPLAPNAPGSQEAMSFTIYGPTSLRVRAADHAGNVANWSNEATAEPGGPEHYRAVWHEWNGGVQQMSAWGGPRGFADGLRVPRAEGEPDTVWIVKSEATRSDGYLTVERMNGTAAGAPRYVGHLAVKFRDPALPDTLVAWWDGRLVRWVQPSEIVFYQRPHNIGNFVTTGPTLLPYGSETARIWTQSQIQWALRERLCELFGFWISAGEVQPCASGE